MTSDQEIRSAAIQAAATCAVSVGLGEPAGVLRVAEMMETYISTGADAAQKVIDSWGASAESATPQERTAGGSRRPNISRAQELADQAYAATSRVQVNEVSAVMQKERMEDEIVNVQGVGGTLSGYVEHRLKDFPEERGQSLRSELGL